MSEEVSLTIPDGVRINTIMDFLGRGHGYTWKTVSKEPVLMVLGHPSKSDHPELVIVKHSLVVGSSSERMRARMKTMLDVLARLALNGHGGMV